MSGLRLDFDRAGHVGSLDVRVEVATTGFPRCEARVHSTGDGYDRLFGWIQTVGTAPVTGGDRIFRLDPLEIFAGTDMPFAFHGIEPVLFDAPSRRDLAQTLDWLAHSFLVTSPDAPMDRTITAVAAFRWGFVLDRGAIATIEPSPLDLATWQTHRPMLADAFPTWTFT